MRPRFLRLLVSAMVVAITALVAATVPRFEDYEAELLPAVRALLAGDVAGAMSQAPIYGASLGVRVPGMVVADALGAGEIGVYRAGVFVCALGVAALVCWLLVAMGRAGRSSTDRAVVAALCLGTPVLLGAYTAGHPEEPLAGVLSIAAILAAIRQRPGLAGLAVGAAIATKPWAVMVVPLALACTDRRTRLMAGAALGCGALVAPFLLADLGHVVTTTGGASGTGWIFHPWQVWWPLRTEDLLPGGIAAYAGPAWLATWAHPIVVAAAVPPALAWQRRRAAGANGTDALGVLALVLLLRCLLDPWNSPYYAVPAILALAAWESLRGHGLPVFALLTAALTWLTTVEDPITWAGTCRPPPTSRGAFRSRRPSPSAS